MAPDEHPQVSVDRTGDRPAVVKSAGPGPAAERLRREAEVLIAAQHPGVVGVISVRDVESSGGTAPGVELRVRFAGSRTLANVTRAPVEKIAGIVAALATTVADLHEMGISHGRITPDHVLLANDGRPILCGLAEAQVGASPTECQADVIQLGVLLRDLVAPMDNVAPIPDTKFGRRPSWNGYQRRALLNLADQASSDNALVRPTARQFASNIRATVPGAVLPGHDTPTLFADMPYATGEEPDQARWHRSGRPLVELARSIPLATFGAGALGLSLLVAAVVLLGAPKEGPSPLVAPLAPDRAPQGTTTTNTPRISTTLADEFADTQTRPSTGDEPAVASPAVNSSASHQLPDPDGPGAMSSIESAAGCSTITGTGNASLASGQPCPTSVSMDLGVLTIGDQQFQLGVDDAAVAIGNFSCSGLASAAVLDRSSGEVFVFHTWATPGLPVTAASLKTIVQGSRLLAEPGPDGCHRLITLDAFGVRHVIPTT